MSYTIQYGPKSQKNKHPQRNPFWGWSVALVILIATIASMLFPQAADTMKNAIFPWSQPDVKEAFNDFSSSVKNGEDFQSALVELYVNFLKIANDET